jgi:hypothetical protein
MDGIATFKRRRRADTDVNALKRQEEEHGEIVAVMLLDPKAFYQSSTSRQIRPTPGLFSFLLGLAAGAVVADAPRLDPAAKRRRSDGAAWGDSLHPAKTRQSLGEEKSGQIYIIYIHTYMGLVNAKVSQLVRSPLFGPGEAGLQ